MGNTSHINIDMPKSMRHYWDMWNEPDVDKIRGHLEQAVSHDMLFVDPVHHHVGRDSLEANVRTLRTDKPEYFFVMASELDGHNQRFRYRWDMVKKGRVLLKGFDVTTLNSDGLIERVDGFFGDLKTISDAESGA